MEQDCYHRAYLYHLHWHPKQETFGVWCSLLFIFLVWTWIDEIHECSVFQFGWVLLECLADSVACLLDGIAVGLRSPSSQFRETTKDVSSGALSNTSTLTNTTSTAGSNLATWGAQAVSNAVQKTSNAISKAIKKNSAKLATWHIQSFKSISIIEW